MPKKITDVRQTTSYHLNQLDLDQVAAEIRATENGFEILEFDLETVGEMVWSACDRWLVDDIHEYEILGVEQYFTFPFQDRRRSGVMDLRLQSRLYGDVTVVDWKTTKGKLDVRWINKYYYSWQNKLYFYADKDAKYFQYRGITYEGSCKHFTLDRPENLEDKVERQILSIAEVQKTLKTFQVWPRNMPHACFAYGTECPYLSDCENETMPKDFVKLDSINASDMDSFLLCPERYRRDELAAKEIGGMSRYTLEMGQAFHRGMAEVYRQSAKVFQNREIPKTTRG